MGAKNSDSDKTAPAAVPADIAGLSFEVALKELESVVERLERGDIDLESSIEAYSRGTLLKRHCEVKLADAQARIEKLMPADDGGAEPKTVAFED